jgi:hypothetical protein
VDKFPLFVASPISDVSPVVTFSYVDSGRASLSNFVAHLGAYQVLVRQLKSFHFLYVAPKATQFGSAETRFRNFIKRPLESDVSSEIVRYFDVRRKWERHEYVIPVTEDLEFLAEARRRFHGERFENLYEAWCTGRLAERELRSEFRQLTPDRTVSFATYLVRNGRSPLDERYRNKVNGA